MLKLITIMLEEYCVTYFGFLYFHHETIIRTRITCKKIPCYSATQPAGGLLLKMLKYFAVMLNMFEFSHEKEIVES